MEVFIEVQANWVLILGVGTRGNLLVFVLLVLHAAGGSMVQDLER